MHIMASHATMVITKVQQSLTRNSAHDKLTISYVRFLDCKI